MVNFAIQFDKQEMIQALENNGYEIIKQYRSDKNPIDGEIFHKSVYIVYLRRIEIVDTAYPCRYNNLDIVEEVFSEVLKRKLLKLITI